MVYTYIADFKLVFALLQHVFTEAVDASVDVNFIYSSKIFVYLLLFLKAVVLRKKEIKSIISVKVMFSYVYVCELLHVQSLSISYYFKERQYMTQNSLCKNCSNLPTMFSRILKLRPAFLIS